MSWTDLAFSTTFVLIVLLFLLSILESSISGLSQVGLKVLAEKEPEDNLAILENISKDRGHFLLPLQLGIQVVQITIAVLVTMLAATYQVITPVLVSVLVMVGILSIFRHLLPRILTGPDPERILLALSPFFRFCYKVLHWLSSPLLLILSLVHAYRAENHKKELPDEETGEEEIEAFIDLGEEEGIIEKEETELIHSALEFGNTLVREIMTPRVEITGIEEKSTIAELRKLMVSSKHSRIPVFREHLDNVVGVAYLRHLLAYLETGSENDQVTSVMHRPLIIPETKRVAELLKEMQQNAEHLATVISEYGSVTGVVTLEDLVEEIVGEIRDEDELQKTDLVRESADSYTVGGRVGVHEVEEALGVDLHESEAATISGFVVARLGRVPQAGEVFHIDGLDIQVLSSDRRCIHALRIRKLQEASP
ncbi:MAG: HlyC/CorC family transporter [Acidobacteria bacterium]|nr:HlyC/CorC family transporter [Acidobacteriota bacterium]